MIGQFVGGVGGVVLVALFVPHWMAHPTVNYAVTVPGPAGTGVAFFAELIISFILMLTVLIVSNKKNLNRFTGVFAGILVATYITFEAPFSGMSMNPARTFGSALPANFWNSLWIYFSAPPLGMLAAAELYVRSKGLHRVLCAKLHHENEERCIFRCNYGCSG
jgi:aquaporin Z